jgi:hypothetical protein
MMGSTEELLLMPLPAWYRGVFSRMDIMELRDRTEARQAHAFYALKDAGKSLLSTPVQRRDHFMKIDTA